MRVTTVQVERRKSDNNYGNRMMMASAELAEGEDPAAVLDALAALVQDGILRAEQADQARQEAQRQEQLAQYRAEQEEARRRTAAAIPVQVVTGDDLAAGEDWDQKEAFTSAFGGDEDSD